MKDFCHPLNYMTCFSSFSVLLVHKNFTKLSLFGYRRVRVKVANITVQGRYRQKYFPHCLTYCWSPSLIGKEKLTTRRVITSKNWVYSSLFNVLSSRFSLGSNSKKSRSRIGHTVNWNQQIKPKQMLVFEGRGKPERPEKNLSVQSTEPTNSIHVWCRVWESNPGHIGGRRVLTTVPEVLSELGVIVVNEIRAEI